MRPARRDRSLFLPWAARGGVGLALAALTVAAQPAAGEGLRVEARRVAATATVHVDGSLKEQAWQGASWFEDFRQSVPDFGQPATESTSVAFLFDDNYLYVAVRCNDSAPELIRASKLRHRDEPESDDHVKVVLDTYRDLIRGTVFVVNPNGAREEGLINGYQHYTWSWDEVWEARATITPAGWQAELAIPWRLLRYSGAREQEWGINVIRVVRHKQEEVYLSPPPPPYDISSLNYAAILTGLELGRRQRNLQLTPYALAGSTRATEEVTGTQRRGTISELGADLKYSLTSDLTLDATYNTDFAQVESDDEQVNLTRFSLFYPEKRAFFLENADLFSFGDSGGPYGPSLTPFFSRRIGLHEGSTVPIRYGARLTGKVGRQDVGVLSVRTDDVDALDLDASWYNVARVRRDLGGRSYVGGIVTDSRHAGERSTTLGLDGEWHLTENLLARGFYLAVDDTASGDTAAYGAALDLTTDPWGFLFDASDIDAGFDPELGYVQRDGFRRLGALVRRSFRPGLWGIRRVSFRSTNYWYESLVHDVRESSHINLECELELETGDELSVSVSRDFERLFEPFELDEDLVFAAGGYTTIRSDLEFHSDESRRWGVDGEGALGEFFDGDTTQLEAEVWWVLSRHFRVAGSYALYDVSAAHGAIDWDLWAARLDYTHSATVSASLYLQHNSSTDTTTVNLRLRWILPNDSDLFLVLDDRRDVEQFGRTLRGRDAAVKVSYRFFL